MPDGSVSKKTVSDITGAVITVSGNFQTADGTNTAPNVMSTWILETSGGTSAQNLQNQLYRVLVVTEEVHMEEDHSHLMVGVVLLHPQQHQHHHHHQIHLGVLLEFVMDF